MNKVNVNAQKKDSKIKVLKGIQIKLKKNKSKKIMKNFFKNIILIGQH